MYTKPFSPISRTHFQYPIGSDRIESYINANLQSRYLGIHFWPFLELNFQNPIGSDRIESYMNAKLQ